MTKKKDVVMINSVIREQQVREAASADSVAEGRLGQIFSLNWTLCFVVLALSPAASADSRVSVVLPLDSCSIQVPILE